MELLPAVSIRDLKVRYILSEDPTYITNYKNARSLIRRIDRDELLQELVRKYSDHSRGALEIMKALSDRLPEGITLLSWSYVRDEGLSLRGESDGQDLVLQFKDALVEIGGDEKLFPVVNLGGFSSAKGGKQRFDIECSSVAEEEE